MSYPSDPRYAVGYPEESMNKSLLAISVVMIAVAAPASAQRHERLLEGADPRIERSPALDRGLGGLVGDPADARTHANVPADVLLGEGSPESMILVPGAAILRDAVKDIPKAPVLRQTIAVERRDGRSKAAADEAGALATAVDRLAEPGADASRQLDKLYLDAGSRREGAEPGAIVSLGAVRSSRAKGADLLRASEAAAPAAAAVARPAAAKNVVRTAALAAVLTFLGMGGALAATTVHAVVQADMTVVIFALIAIGFISLVFSGTRAIAGPFIVTGAGAAGAYALLGTGPALAASAGLGAAASAHASAPLAILMLAIGASILYGLIGFAIKLVKDVIADWRNGSLSRTVKGALLLGVASYAILAASAAVMAVRAGTVPLTIPGISAMIAGTALGFFLAIALLLSIYRFFAIVFGVLWMILVPRR